MFGIGSVHPGALLLDAFRLYTQKQGIAYKVLKSIAHLSDAIEALIECAEDLVDKSNQELVLQVTT